MKNLFCKKLAALLCMTPMSSRSQELPEVLHTKTESVVIGDNCNNTSVDHDYSTASDPTTENDSVKELLKEIRDILKARVHSEDEESYEDHKKNEKKKDWMLAAVVLDRICAIAFTVVFVAGTLIFIIVFVVHQSS